MCGDDREKDRYGESVTLPIWARRGRQRQILKTETGVSDEWLRLQYMCLFLRTQTCEYVSVCAHLSLGCILAQLLMPHEELLSLLEGLADGVALVDGLDGGSSDVLDGCD